MILLDTSILIEFFRKKNKNETIFSKLSKTQNTLFAISVISEYEVMIGSKAEHFEFWSAVFSKIEILDFDYQCVSTAVKIQTDLKKHNQIIDIPDLFIAATAVQHNLEVVTLNKKHFSRVKGISLFEQV